MQTQDRLEIVTTASHFNFTAKTPALPWSETGYDPDLEAVQALRAMLQSLRARSIAFDAPTMSYKASG